jgi:type IV secretory pathway TrbL component
LSYFLILSKIKRKTKRQNKKKTMHGLLMLTLLTLAVLAILGLLVYAVFFMPPRAVGQGAAGAAFLGRAANNAAAAKPAGCLFC